MKILFIDHAYHCSTKSSGFMLNFFKLHYEVEVLNVNPGDDLELKFDDNSLKSYEFVVLWQIDYLATYFLLRDIKTIVIPMFDSSSTLDPVHWEKLKGALFINFSIGLHSIIESYGCSSVYVKYFPDILSANYNVSIYDKNVGKPKAFFWERRPDTEINVKNIARLLKNSISHLHVHQAPDPGLVASDIPKNLGFTTSTSKWFEHPSEYLNTILAHDIYVAPRYSEGIGMGFLEAMSFGRIVLAHDSSTHNEYIKNHHNGVLFNAFRSDIVNLSSDNFHIISRNALSDSINLRSAWVSFYEPLILDRIKNYVGEKCKYIYRLNNGLTKNLDFLHGLLAAHNNWERYYSTLENVFVENISDPLIVPIIADVNRLEKSRNIDLAKNMLLSRAREFEGPNIYHSILDLLTDRCK